MKATDPIVLPDTLADTTAFRGHLRDALAALRRAEADLELALAMLAKGRKVAVHDVTGPHLTAMHKMVSYVRREVTGDDDELLANLREIRANGAKARLSFAHDAELARHAENVAKAAAVRAENARLEAEKKAKASSIANDPLAPQSPNIAL